MEELSLEIQAQAAAAGTNGEEDRRLTTGERDTASWEVLELRRTIARAQEGIAGLELPPDMLDLVNASLRAAAEEAGRPTPRRFCVAAHLGAAAATLQEAGALGAGTTVHEALRRAADLLGPIGVAVIGAL
jgi:hypothetical protein